MARLRDFAIRLMFGGTRYTNSLLDDQSGFVYALAREEGNWYFNATFRSKVIKGSL